MRLNIIFDNGTKRDLNINLNVRYPYFTALQSEEGWPEGGDLPVHLHHLGAFLRQGRLLPPQSSNPSFRDFWPFNVTHGGGKTFPILTLRKFEDNLEKFRRDMEEKIVFLYF